MRIFWKLYLLFFAIPFPMIIYYPLSRMASYRGSWWAITLLVLSLVLWSLVLFKLYKRWVASPIAAKSAIGSLLREGAIKNAEIVSVRKVKSSKEDVEELALRTRMLNFSGTPILVDLHISDSQPYQRRYEVGKSVRLRIDTDLKSQPYLVPEGSQVTLKMGRLIWSVVAWLFVIVLVIGYYIFSYQLENNGLGWRFLAFWHPLIICPLSILFLYFGFIGFIGRFHGLSKNILKVKFYGKRALATIIRAEQTGTYINEQPQVHFDLEYLDAKAQIHQVSVKKIVDLLDLGITQEKTIPIFYVEDDPEQIAFVSDLEF